MAAALHETAQPSERMTDGDGGCKYIQQCRNGNIFPFCINTDCDYSQDESAVKDQPALIHTDDPQQPFLTVPILDHVQQPCADQTAEQCQHTQIKDLFRGQSGAVFFPEQQSGSAKKTEGDTYSIKMDRLPENGKCDGIHE